MEEEQITGPPGRCSPFMAGLAVALQHPLVSSDPKAVCSLLQVCKAWRAVVQQSAAGTTVVTLGKATPPTLAGFAAWMVNHAGLLGQLSINLPKDGLDGSWGDRRAYSAVAESLMSLSLQLACSRPPAAGSGGSAAAEQAAVQSHKQALRLRSFSSDMLHSPAILSALPAASLTHLQLSYPNWQPSGRAATAAALAQLSSLQQLTISGDFAAFPFSCLSGISMLARLTALHVAVIGADINTHHFPQQLQTLALKFFTMGTLRPLVDLRHLSCLEQLELYSAYAPLAAGSAIPTQLRSLDLTLKDDGESCLVSLNVTGLQQLQQLTVASTSREAGAAQQLQQQVAALPNLKQLGLEYWWKVPSLAAAPSWQLLPQLRCLKISLDDEDGVTARELGIVLQGIAAVGQLTLLHLSAGIAVEEGEEIGICSHLNGLSQLQELELQFDYPHGRVFKERDAMQLTSLTALRKLGFGNGWPEGVGDAAAVALACELTQLEWLNLYCCGLSGIAALPAIARLSNLQHLCLCGNAVTDEGGLMILTRLSRLTHLDLCDGNTDQDEEQEFPAAVAERFWAAVRGQHQQMGGV